MGFFECMIWNALEASILAVVLMIALKLWKASPPVRHILWLLVVVKLLVPPVALHSVCLSGACSRAVGIASSWTSGAGGESELLQNSSKPVVIPEKPSSSPSPALDLQEEVGAALFDREWPGGGGEAAGDVEALSNPPAPRETSSSWLFLTISSFQVILPLIWLAGSLLVFLRQGFRVAAFQVRLLRSSEPAPEDVILECNNLMRKFRIRRTPRLRVVDERVSPMIWPLGRPVILLSRELMGSLDRDCLQNVLAHELAHLKRRDHWTSWIELAAGCLYWWLPTFRVARRELRLSADESADSWAVWALGSRKTYAKSLLETVQLLAARSLPAPALGRSLSERQVIERRLIMIMRDPLHHRLSWPAIAGTALVGLLVLPAAPERLQAQGAGVSEVAIGEGTPAEMPAEISIAEVEGVGFGADEPAGERRALQPGSDAPQTPPNTERRLRALEEKMEMILKQLKAMDGKAKMDSLREDARDPFGGYYRLGRGGMESSGGRTGSSSRRRASGAAGSSVSDETAAGASTNTPSAPASRRFPSSGGRAVQQTGSSRSRFSLNGEFSDDLQDPNREELSPEQREEIDALNREFQEKMEKLRREHRNAIRKILDGPKFGAEVQAVKEEGKLVILSVGRDQNIRKGTMFNIYHDDILIAIGRVIRVYDDLAEATIDEVQEGERIQIGDRATINKVGRASDNRRTTR